MLERGGSAADGAVGAAAVMAVVGPHLCGMGGDLLAMVKSPGKPPLALLAVGRAGSGADPDALRARGLADMPLRDEICAATVPGAVDGWLALHGRFGRLPLEAVLEPAITLAEEGFACSTLLALASPLVAQVTGAGELCAQGPPEIGQLVRLPGIGRTLRAVGTDGREGFYRGEFGEALLRLGRGEYLPADLTATLAEWTEPISLRAFEHDLWTVPPPSQGYLTLGGAWIAEQVGLPVDPADPRWPHVVAEAARAAGFDRPAMLHDGADGQALVSPERLARRAAAIDTDRASLPLRGVPVDAAGTPAGDTTHLCAVDATGLGISLTQSNALDFGTHLVVGNTGVFLHNRGVGFNLEPGHPDEYRARRRPAHTLSPALGTRPDGSLAHLVGTMGGDAQPQIILQLVARVLHSGEDPAAAIAAPRVVLRAPDEKPFRLWSSPTHSLHVEAHAPETWIEGLTARGHGVQVVSAFDPVDVGCAQIVSAWNRAERDVWAGASDPRSPEGGAIGF